MEVQYVVTWDVWLGSLFTQVWDARSLMNGGVLLLVFLTLSCNSSTRKLLPSSVTSPPLPPQSPLKPHATVGPKYRTVSCRRTCAADDVVCSRPSFNWVFLVYFITSVLLSFWFDNFVFVSNNSDSFCRTCFHTKIQHVWDVLCLSSRKH